MRDYGQKQNSIHNSDNPLQNGEVLSEQVLLVLWPNIYGICSQYLKKNQINSKKDLTFIYSIRIFRYMNEIIKELLNTLEQEINDGYNTLPDYQTNNEGKTYINLAQSTLDELKKQLDNQLSCVIINNG